MGAHLISVDFVPTEALGAAVYRHGKAFEVNTQRQNNPGSAHHDTEAILLRGPKHASPENWLVDMPQEDYPILRTKEWTAAKNMLVRVARIVKNQLAWKEQPSIKMGKAMIVKLKPGGHIDWHIDEGSYAENYVRYHLPLVTNPLAALYSGGEVAHFPVGTLLYFDNRVKHSALNAGLTHRIHLICDFRKPEPQ